MDKELVGVVKWGWIQTRGEMERWELICFRRSAEKGVGFILEGLETRELVYFGRSGENGVGVEGVERKALTYCGRS